MAITDHGTLGGAIDFYTQAKKIGVKPIIGVEAYVDISELRENNYPGHLTILAQNESGYRALIAANNLAHRQFYYRPRITIQQIIERGFAKDWVILSGCMSSPIYDLPHTEAVELCKQLATHAGYFFLEFMWHYSDDEQFNVKQDLYLEKMAAIHKATGYPMAITNDCHYSEPRFEEIHRELMRQSKEPEGLEFDGEGFYFKTQKQMQDICDSLGIPNGVANAIEASKMCNLVIPEAEKVNWYVPDITGGNPKAKMVQLCEAALTARGFGKEYLDRYHHELSVLETSSAILNSYLVTYDLVYWCNERGYPVAARGSMAGSLISYLLGITQEDPVKWSLSFSRAVSPARPTIPDFDLDVSSIHRQDILNYLKEKYDNNIPIAAYTHYGPKGALRKVLRMEGKHDYPTQNELCKALPQDWSDGDFEYSVTGKRFIGKAPWFEEVPENYRDFMAIYKGLFSNMTVHPSGVLVGGPERELEHEVPLQWIASSKALVSAFDMYTLKKTGLYKLDVLGLRTLDQLDYMQRVSGARLPDDNYDDPYVLKAFDKELLAEIFQMDGYACQAVLHNIRPITHFEDLVAANTLARPGVAEFAKYYRSGYENLVREYPLLEPVLGYTNGLILYQEQVMEIARVLADFDDAEQDDVKESIKYFNHTNWSNTIEPKFRSRCEPKGINPTNILDAISRMSMYTYNRNHAMTYAALSYKMMFYKCYHPAAFYAAVYDGTEDKDRLVLESQIFDVIWHPADINISQESTIVIDNEIWLGLGAIKGVGPAAYAALDEARPFTSVEDLEARVARRKCNISVIKRLKEAFACESIGYPGTDSAFQESFGFSKKFLDTEVVKKLVEGNTDYSTAGFISDLRSFSVKKAGPNQGKEMAIVSISNVKGKRKCILFPDVYKKARGKLYKGMPIKFIGEYQISGDFVVQSGESI